MKDIIYLKSDEFSTYLLAFNPNRLERVSVVINADHRYCGTSKFSNETEYQWSLDYDLQHNWTIATREEFNDAFIAYSKMLNDITKEL